MAASLNKVRAEFKEFFNAHPEIHHYFYGAQDDYVAIDDKKYFSVNCEFISGTPSGKYINYQFNIIIADLIDLNYPESEHDTVSNALLIGQDFLAWLDENDYTYSGTSMQPFREEMGDMCAGIVMTVSLQLPMGLNACAVPT